MLFRLPFWLAGFLRARMPTETSRLIRDGVRQSEDVMMFRRIWPSPLAEMIAFVYRSSY